MKKHTGLQFAAAAAAAAIIPFAVSKAVDNPPDVSKIMAAAINFTANPSFSTEISGFGNGNLILYKPNPPEITQINTEVPSRQTDPPETEPDSVTEPEIISTEPPAAEETNPADKSYMITQNIFEAPEDLSVFGSSDLKVRKTTFDSNPDGFNFIPLAMGGRVRNCTELDNDFVKSESEIPTEIKLEAYSDLPQVLIMHTHTTESYLVGSGDFQDENYTCRTADSTQSVVAVGQKMSEKLAEKGICVIHDGTLHDRADFNKAYAYSEETVAKILEKYPSIKVVFDVHRDGIVEGDGTPVAAVNTINGKEAAQVMIISAATDGYYYVPDYLQNFHFACLLQQYMESTNPGITRPILFQYCNYNQHLTTGSLLLEVGSQGNTLEQALYTGELIGESIGAALMSICE
ncbi:MAG TPA: stage II sporulation protein P [Ruminococcaceae bacterium]|nr:stage II sporulation protein P [Oscillospiraceae bacterium]